VSFPEFVCLAVVTVFNALKLDLCFVHKKGFQSNLKGVGMMHSRAMTILKSIRKELKSLHSHQCRFATHTDGFIHGH
jgi:hypothetical protein